MGCHFILYLYLLLAGSSGLYTLSNTSISFKKNKGWNVKKIYSLFFYCSHLVSIVAHRQEKIFCDEVYFSKVFRIVFKRVDMLKEN